MGKVAIRGMSKRMPLQLCSAVWLIEMLPFDRLASALLLAEMCTWGAEARCMEDSRAVGEVSSSGARVKQVVQG